MSAPEWQAVLHELAASHALEVAFDAPLDRCTTLRIGGRVEALVGAGDAPSLSALVRFCAEHALGLSMVGRGANVLFSSAGVDGVVCRLEGTFKESSIDGLVASAGGAVVLAQLARQCAKRGLLGLEALAGFPASVGGAIAMNAGCYGTEIIDVLLETEVMHPVSGETETWSPEQLGAEYRSTRAKTEGWIVLGGRFQLAPGDAASALARLDELNRRRWESLPSGVPNAGSTFRNPAGDYAGRLLEDVGFKGRTLGGAAFSEKHANVVVNLGEASSSEVKELIAAAQRAVRAAHGVELHEELVFIGREEGSR